MAGRAWSRSIPKVGFPTVKLHQYLAGASPGDAITDQALLIRRWLREMGFTSEIFAEHIHSEIAEQVRPLSHFRPRRDGPWLIIHLSIGSSFLDEVTQLGLKLILIYHNVTPPAFFNAVDPASARLMAQGREQLNLLVPLTKLALGDSSYNEEDLRSQGYKITGVLPISLDENRYQWPDNDDIVRDLGRNPGAKGGPLLLFVGRISPNKKQEDLVKLLYYYRRIEPAARLVLVGDNWLPAYARWIVELAESLELADALLLTGRVSQQDLVTYYRNCDLYLSMSEHEGFGKPFIESMYLGLPIMAYRSAAVPSTLGDTGLLFTQKDFEALAEVVQIIISDHSLQNRIIRHQKERVQNFLEPVVKEIFRRYLANLGLQ